MLHTLYRQIIAAVIPNAPLLVLELDLTCKQGAPFAGLHDGCIAWDTIEAMSMIEAMLCDEREWMQLNPLPNNSSPDEFMARVSLALECHIPYLERSFASNTSISEWVVAQTPFVYGYAAQVMFDALNVDEKNNPSDVASRIFEIMSWI